MRSTTGHAGTHMKYVMIILALAAGVILIYYLAPPRSGPYKVGIHNRTGADIENASVRTRSYVASMGFIVDDGRAAYGLFRGSIPSSAEVRWTSSDGRPHAVLVSLAGIVPAKFDGTIYFTVQADGTVSAAAVPLAK